MWAKKGTRPMLPVCQQRDKVYLIGFVEPMTGVWVSYLLPVLNGDWYAAVLRLLAEHFDHEPIKLIVDQAGWHTNGDMPVPKNISLEFLPPHSPELNPTEQIWEDVRYNYTRNQTFTDGETLWDTLEQVMKVYSANPERVKSITNQRWMYGKKQT
jgi:transposase